MGDFKKLSVQDFARSILENQKKKPYHYYGYLLEGWEKGIIDDLFETVKEKATKNPHLTEG